MAFKAVVEDYSVATTALSIFFLDFFLLVYLFNPFPNDKILDTIKLKAFAADKLNIAEMIDFSFR